MEWLGQNYILASTLVGLCLLAALLGVVVVLNNPKKTVNKIYGAFNLMGIIWITVNLATLSLTKTLPKLLSASLITPTSLATCILFLFLALHFGRKVRYSRWLVHLSALIFLIVSALSLTAWNIVPALGNQGLTFELGPFYPMYLGLIAVYASAGLGVLAYKYKKLLGRQKVQVGYMLLGLFLTLVPAIITGAVLPLLGYEKLSNLSPGFSVFFLVATAYAIVRHRLFDIRLIVARSLAYVLLLTTLASLYGVTIFGVTNLFFETSEIGLAQNLVYIGLAVVLAFTFQPLRRFFEKLTDRIFYRDKYDSAEVINEIGNILASELLLERILDKVLKTVCDSLKVSAGQLVVFNKNSIYQVVHQGPVPTPIPESELIKLESKMLIADELEDSEEKRALDAHGIRLSLPLRASEEFVGFLLLGDKQSGNIYTNQDVELLGVVDDELAVGIQNAKAYEEIRKFSQTMQRKVQEATLELRLTNAKLKKLDEAKDEFISMASHQLRTPLTTIKGYLSMLLEGDGGKITKKQREFIDMAFSGSERMVYLISDLLNVSRMNTGKFVIEKKPFDLAKMVGSEVKQLSRYAEGKDVELIYNQPKGELNVNLDENKTRQVVMNLIDNAIYYTPSSGKVEVSLTQDKDGVEFRVKDSGIGVPEAEKDKLFTKFYRASNAQKARAEGTGLGLFMAKKVVEDQGGKVIFESTEGKGSTFGFWFDTEDIKAE